MGRCEHVSQPHQGAPALVLHCPLLPHLNTADITSCASHISHRVADVDQPGILTQLGRLPVNNASLEKGLSQSITRSTYILIDPHIDKSSATGLEVGKMSEAWMESVPGHGLCCCCGSCCCSSCSCRCCRRLRCLKDDGSERLGWATYPGNGQALVTYIHPAEIDLLHDERDGLWIGDDLVWSSQNIDFTLGRGLIRLSSISMKGEHLL